VSAPTVATAARAPMRPAPGAGTGAAPAASGVVQRATARVAAFAALALFGILHWMALVAPTGSGRGLLVVIVATAGAAACGSLGARLPSGARRVVAVVALSVVVVVLTALAAGLPAHLLKPARWGELVGGVGRGADGFARATVPYAGPDGWTRRVIELLGGGLVALAALAAFAPRRERAGRLVAVLALGAVFAVPTILLTFQGQLVRGAVFALLLGAFLWLDRVPGADGRAAGLVALVAVVVGFAATPLLDADRSRLDWQQWGISLAGGPLASFDWEHRYGPLEWSRSGRQVLRVKTRRPAYWKVENLDVFDGVRWRRGPEPGQVGGLVDIALERRVLPGFRGEWLQRDVRFTIGAMRTSALRPRRASIAGRSRPTSTGFSPAKARASMPITLAKTSARTDPPVRIVSTSIVSTSTGLMPKASA